MKSFKAADKTINFLAVLTQFSTRSLRKRIKRVQRSFIARQLKCLECLVSLPRIVGAWIARADTLTVMMTMMTLIPFQIFLLSSMPKIFAHVSIMMRRFIIVMVMDFAPTEMEYVTMLIMSNNNRVSKCLLWD
ncbi:CLUMA_CG007529, isoform A [Clunio marinus]|uniref:CLUMA_CG007529, isoform A n=1 Tax=Clunio marinus TaxID=568069 RepID=A0A1J1I330_9DIPT|nr:CLUMA_CG007529, isoform A [Clunio marinus]